MTIPRILTIAGSDSSGGAGIQADLKTITVLGGYAMSAITAVTAQNTLGVSAIAVLTPELVAAQIDACVSDIGVDAIKLGMLGSPEIAAVVAERIAVLGVPIVFDPVMIATSGAALADAATIAGFERLMQLATLTTPNLAELAVLGGGWSCLLMQTTPVRVERSRDTAHGVSTRLDTNGDWNRRYPLNLRTVDGGLLA